MNGVESELWSGGSENGSMKLTMYDEAIDVIDENE